MTDQDRPTERTAQDDDDSTAGAAPRTRIRRRSAGASAPTDSGQDAAETAEASDDDGGAVRRRRRRREPVKTATGSSDTAAGPGRDTAGATKADDAEATAEGAEATAEGAEAEPAAADEGPAAAAQPSPAADEAPQSDEGAEAETGGRTRDQRTAEDDSDGAAEQSGSTRLRGRSGQRSPARGRGRRPAPGLVEETRRAINEGPPRRMLVTTHGSRTQIAVLEERNLVEHYVTDKDAHSYVGNIYLGRVQNVLPGMEAAFVDIGKGRNGVLYAGEVNFDEADLDDEAPRIERTLKPGQTVLVQVTKDPMGTKGARLTQQLSVAGRFCVLAPGEGMLGISRKLPEAERQRLRHILQQVKPDGYGLIVRTAAEGATHEQLEADVTRLVRIWEQIEERAASAKALEVVYEEPDLVMRVVRDVFGAEYSELIVDDGTLGEQIRDYLAGVSQEMADKVSVYRGEGRLFDEYEVTTQIRRALEKKVWLASGGYLIIEKTEAMWIIDVNTGKFVGERNLEATVLQNNLEAAEEIVRQLRLRDMGGIIVIDFVDMLVPANRDEVLKRFKRELARDKTKSRVMDISKLGLVQMTRKNVSQGLQESFTFPCDHCEGRGAQIVDDLLA